MITCQSTSPTWHNDMEAFTASNVETQVDIIKRTTHNFSSELFTKKLNYLNVLKQILHLHFVFCCFFLFYFLSHGGAW